MAPIWRPRIWRIVFVRQVVDASPVEPDLAAGNAPGRIEQTDDRRAGQRLAGARLADDAEDLARRDVERDVVERDERAGPARELDRQIADVQQRLGHDIRTAQSSGLGVRTVTRSTATGS